MARTSEAADRRLAEAEYLGPKCRDCCRTCIHSELRLGKNTKNIRIYCIKHNTDVTSYGVCKDFTKEAPDGS